VIVDCRLSIAERLKPRQSTIDKGVDLEPDVMSGPSHRRQVLVTNPQGFHLRPMAAFVRLALQFPGEVYVLKEEQRANGKSVLDLMGLAAMPGTELTIEVCGDNAPEMLGALAEVINTPVDDPDMQPPPATGI